MCTQINNLWACGHSSFLKIRFCSSFPVTCKGTTAKHESVVLEGKCSDCTRAETMPNPLVSK